MRGISSPTDVLKRFCVVCRGRRPRRPGGRALLKMDVFLWHYFHELVGEGFHALPFKRLFQKDCHTEDKVDGQERSFAVRRNRRTLQFIINVSARFVGVGDLDDPNMNTSDYLRVLL